MPHRIHILVATPRRLEPLTRQHSSAHVIALPQDLAMVPLTRSLYQQIPAIGDPDVPAMEGFARLTTAVALLGVQLSGAGTVMYCETNYSGGKGSQGAVVWKDGRCVFGPHVSRAGGGRGADSLLERPINRALRYLRVQKGDHLDEFEALGFRWLRADDDCVSAALGPKP